LSEKKNLLLQYLKMSNPMKEIKIEKLTLNIGIGKPGDELERSAALLKRIANQKAVLTKTMKRIPTWSLRPNLPIATKVTLRKKHAEELLKRLLNAVHHRIPESKFDKNGNFSFGIPEYIDIEGVEYDPKIGIIGLEAAVTLERAGFRVKKRRIKRSKIRLSHKITKQEAIAFMKSKFNILTAGEEA